jgi:TPR repeat protein
VLLRQGPPRGQQGAIDNAPSKQSQQQSSGSGEFEDAAQPVKNISYAPVDTASLPDGITMQSNDATTEQIVQHQQQARMAYLSGQLGVAAAKATPAALMEEHVLRMNGAPARTDDLEGGANTSRLPPPTVGPFSLRGRAQGDPSAQYEVAVRLAQGKGDTDQDLKEAAQWYQRAATSGFAMAQFRLGTLYERGVGVTTDIARAQVWYGRAAEQGNVKACTTWRSCSPAARLRPPTIRKLRAGLPPRPSSASPIANIIWLSFTRTAWASRRTRSRLTSG